MITTFLQQPPQPAPERPSTRDTFARLMRVPHASDCRFIFALCELTLRESLRPGQLVLTLHRGAPRTYRALRSLGDMMAGNAFGARESD